MTVSPLSPNTKVILQKIFEKNAWDEATRVLMEGCGDNLSFLENWTPLSLERIRLAALKMSHGDLSKLGEAIELASADWRDLLMSAGFSYDTQAHSRWADEVLTDKP